MLPTCWSYKQVFIYSLLLFGLEGGLGPPVRSQSILPATDGTGTIVTPQGDRFQITGGTLSGDQTNLFHSFTRFGLDQNQMAQFLGTPGLQNILARVVGGDPSLINGLIQVTGSNANLYLMNPAGILFGANASLNVPASFTATTATGIGFGSNWLSASGSNPYSALNGSPDRFAFTPNQPGSIVNAGNLTVGTGQNLTMIGGTVLSTGTLNAPGGQILVVTVPGQSIVHLSQPGSLLSLDIQPLAVGTEPWNLPIVMLPQLLTGGNLGHATGVTIDAQGQVQLQGSGLVVQPGDLAVHQLNAQTATLTASQNLLLSESQLYTSRDLNLMAQNTVQVRDTPANPFIAAAGGRLLVQGNQAVDIWALRHQTGGFFSGGEMILRSGGTIGGDSYYQTGGNFRIEQLNGELGAWFSPYDPIVRSDGDVSFGDYTGSSLHILARGSVNVGNITINGSDISGLVESVTLSDGTLLQVNGNSKPTLDIRAGTTTIGGAVGFNPGSPGGSFTPGNPLPPYPAATGSSITTGNITLSSPNGLVYLTNQYAPDGTLPNGTIQTGSISTNSTGGIGGEVVIDSLGSITIGGAINTSSFFTGSANSGAVTLLARDTIQTAGLQTLRAAGAGNGGTLKAVAGGNLDLGVINTSTGSGNGGNVTLIAGTRVDIPDGNVRFNSINVTSIAGVSGSVTLTAKRLVQGLALGTTIDVSSSVGTAGTVRIQHDGGIQNLPFIVGSITPPQNGLAGAINAGAGGQITSGNFPVLPNGGLAAGTPGSISIISVNSPPTLTGNPILIDRLSTAIAPTPFRVGDLVGVSDADQDITQVTLNGLAPGVSLTRNGIPLPPGTLLSLDDVLVYTPPLAGISGSPVAFSLVANDVVSFSGTQSVLSNLSGSALLQSGVLIAPLQPFPPLKSPPLPPPAIIQFLLANEPPGLKINQLETQFTNDFVSALGLEPPTKIKTLANLQETLTQISRLTGLPPALNYINFTPARSQTKSAKTGSSRGKAPVDDQPIWEFDPSGSPFAQQVTVRRDDDELELTVITEKGEIIRKQVPGATRKRVMETARQFRTDATNVRTKAYRSSGKQLYDWFVAPIEAELKARDVKNLSFLVDRGLHSIPLAALYDGKQHLVEKYSVSIMPSFNLVDTRYRPIREAEILAMGASKFATQNPLPAVPEELSLITREVGRGRAFLNEEFTLNNLKAQRRQTPFQIIHLATHGEFRPGSPANSYIQLSDTRLTMLQIRELGWNNPPVDLLVLSACKTAVGDEQAELGFAGFAVQAGVKTALASLWYVSDEGTLGLMGEFYQHLRTAPTKAEALRQAQLALLRGQVRLTDGKLQVADRAISLPPELSKINTEQINHPYYWAAFTMIGSPW